MTVLVHKAVEPTKCNKPGKEMYAALISGKLRGCVMPKYDGVYCQILYSREAGQWQAWSRTGEPLHSAAHILPHFEMHGNPAIRYNGELWMFDTQHSIINGLARKKTVQPALIFMCFDAFDPERMDEGFLHRYDKYVMGMPEKACFLRALVNSPPAKADVITEEYLQGYAKGMQKCSSAYDGAMLVWADGPYVPGSGKDGGKFKVKPRPDADLRVVGVTSGKGKYVGMIGALLLDLGGGKQCEAGSGLTDAERGQAPAWWLNKIVKVSWLSLTKDGLLREPVIECVRFDKTEADHIHPTV